MHGTVLKSLGRRRRPVGAGAPVAVLEAMKMETTINATADGSVSVHVDTGDTVGAGQLLAVIE